MHRALHMHSVLAHVYTVQVQYYIQLLCELWVAARVKETNTALNIWIIYNALLTRICLQYSTI